jgi:MFS family permease
MADPLPTPGAKTWSAGTLTYTAGGLAALFAALLFGDFAWMLKERGVVALFQAYLSNVTLIGTWFEGYDNTLFVLLTGVLPPAIGLIVSPPVGMWSDRLRTRLGRRIPFLIATTPLVVLSMVGLACTPYLAVWLAGTDPSAPPDAAVRTWAIILLAVFWTKFEVVTTVANNLFLALVNDVVPRRIIGQFYGLFRIVSLTTGIIFNFWLMGHAKDWYVILMLSLAGIYAVGFTVVCAYVREGSYEPPPVADGRGAYGRIAAYLRNCFASPYYLLVFAAYAVAQAATSPLNNISMKMSQGYGLSNADYGVAMAFSYCCSLVLAYPIGWITDRFHPMRTTVTCLAAYGAVMVGGYLLVHDAWTFTVFFVLHTVVAGCYWTASGTILMHLLPKASYAEYGSAAHVVSSAVAIPLSLCVGRLLDASKGSPDGSANYLLVFLAGGGVSLAAVLLWIPLTRAFNRRGGVAAYQAPER